MTVKAYMAPSEQSSVPDTWVKCDRCDRREAVNFAQRVRYGWPTCCGETMCLLTTEANIEFSTRQAVTEQLQ